MPQPDIPARTMEVCFAHESARAGNMIMNRLFVEGWETLEPLQYADCGHYWTTLFLPWNAKDSATPKT
jgi:hypothetical protein